MKKLYEKSELRFAIAWIVIYCILQSVANPLNDVIGIQYSASAVFCILLAAVLFAFIKRNGLMGRMGLCRPALPAARFMFYVPLLILVTRNFWNGAAANLPAADTVCYIACMLCVGFVEEIIFRGFLFRAMAEENEKSAIIVTSIAFGAGHLLNLVNGSGADLAENIFQVVGAIAIGFLFVILFHRGKSLWPCIIAHSVINVTSAFANEAGLTLGRRIVFELILLAITIAYALILIRTTSVESGTERKR